MTSAPSPPPKEFGPYRDLARVDDVDSIGEAFVARATVGGFSRRVQLDVLSGPLAEEQDVVDVFINDAQLAATLNHPGIIPVVDVGIHDGIPFVAYEGASGTSLAAVLAARISIPLAVGVHLVKSIGLAVAHAHEASPSPISHGALTPRSVRIGRQGEVRVGGFGIGRARGFFAPDALVEAIPYMSPEIADADDPDPSADIFALGAIAYSILTGRPIFEGDSPAALHEKALTGNVRPIAQVRKDLSPGIAAVIDRALRAEAAERWPSARAMVDALEQAARSLPPFEAEHLDALVELLGDSGSGADSYDIGFEEGTLHGVGGALPSVPTQSGFADTHPESEHPGFDEFSDNEQTVMDSVEHVIAAERPPAAVPVRHLSAKPTTAKPSTVKPSISIPKPAVSDAPRIPSKPSPAARAHAKASQPVGAAPSRVAAANAGSFESLRPSKPGSPKNATGRSADVTTEPMAPRVADRTTKSRALAEAEAAVAAVSPFAATVAEVEPPVPDPSRALGRTVPRDTGAVGPVSAAQAAHPFATPPPVARVEPATPAPSQPVASVPISIAPPTSAADFSATADFAQAELRTAAGGSKLRLVFGALFVVGIGAAAAYYATRPKEEPAPTVVIRTTPPGAMVTLDGRALPSVTPVTILDGLRRGQTHRVEVSLAGYRPVTREFVATGDIELPLPLDAIMVRLHVITVPPGAALTLDGRGIGTSPATIDVRPGRVTVVAALPGRETTQSLELIAEPSEQTVTVTLPEITRPRGRNR